MAQEANCKTDLAHMADISHQVLSLVDMIAQSGPIWPFVHGHCHQQHE